MRAVIIGTGPAGITAAETLRRLDPAGSVVALSAEGYPPYSPPAMADHFLTGRTGTLYWKGTDVARRLGIQERRSTVVEAVDTGHREVLLAGGGRAGYDALIIAAGSRLHAPLPGAQLHGVLNFKSLRTATELIGRVRAGQATSALVVGNGLIGTELALLLADLGVDVTVVEQEAQVMPRLLDADTAAVAEAALRARGVTLRLGLAAGEFIGSTSVTGLRLANGQVMTADMYIAATGVKPHIEFLAGSGVATGWGIHVDDRLRTSAPGVLAAGDVAETADWLTGERYVHAIFPNAVAQGRIAAANALGSSLRYDGAESMNSLKHLGVPVVAIGTTKGAEEVLRHRHAGTVRAVYLRDGHIIGAQLAGDISAAGSYRSLMLRRADVSRYGAALVRPGFGLSDIAWDAVRPGLSRAP